MTLFEVSDFELAMDVVCNYMNHGSLKTTGIIIRSQRLRIAVFGGNTKNMSLRAQRGNRTQAWPPCIACDCFVVPPRNDIFCIPNISLLFFLLLLFFSKL